MARKKKSDYVEDVTNLESDIKGKMLLQTGLVNLLVPTASIEGKILEMDDDGNVTIEFSSPITFNLKLLTIKKLKAFLEFIEEARNYE